MADIDNLNEINENFDTVKTLLNSIRAQGILNTSDVDKLLSGINAKLEKINTEEDIDIIKVFLTELKQNLDERHQVLISKFGAIEALFSNLLKNSNELPKSAELKELFDIVATNLSVFSREVVAQKESLTDIAMRLDAIRSDDSQKKDIIKNITLLKPDLERLNNGFDTIVLSLNDNFKTLAKTMTSLDKTERFDKFADNLNNIEMSSNALLSAIQLLDKKTESVDESLKELATRADVEKTERGVAELRLLSQSLNSSVDEINNHYSKIDNLAEKIDASVSIIAGLKTGLEDFQGENTKSIIENLDKLEAKLNEINDDSAFEAFKTSLTEVLKDITENTTLLDKNLGTASEKLSSMLEMLRALDINTGINTVIEAIDKRDETLRNHFDSNTEKVTNLSEANVTKVINNITLSADSLNTRLNQAQTEISSICESSFGTVFENIAELKKVVSQIDENGVSANNAMFSNISDRLNLFETALKESLETQEYTTAEASAKLNEQVENIRNLSNVMDYKMDSSVVEISNMTRMFETLKGSVDSILALNFVDTVKDLRADIYASKQEVNTALENTSADLSENISKDIYGKYELLISKLDSTEEEFKKVQTSALTYIKEVMDKISESLVDIISYVSESKEFPMEEIDKKISGLSSDLRESNLNYVDSVRDVVDIIRVQVENNLREIQDESAIRLERIQNAVSENADFIKSDIQKSYDKLSEIKSLYEKLGDMINQGSLDRSDKFDKLFSTANNINAEFERKLELLKADLVEKVSEFKNEFACENADKLNEFRFTVENLNNKNVLNLTDEIEKIRVQIEALGTENSEARNSTLDRLLGDLSEVKSLIKNSATDSSSIQSEAFSAIFTNLDSLKSQLQQVSTENADSRSTALNGLQEKLDILKAEIQNAFNDNANSRNSALSSLQNNFEELKNLIQKSSADGENSQDKAIESLQTNINELKEIIRSLSADASNTRNTALDKIYSNFDNLDKLVNELSYDVREGRKAGIGSILDNINTIKEQMTAYATEQAEGRSYALSKLTDNYEELKSKIDKHADDVQTSRTNVLAQLLDNFVGVKEFAQTLNNNTAEKLTQKSNEIIESFESVKSMLTRIDEEIDGDLTRQFSIIESNFESLIAQITILNEKSAQELVDKINDEYKNVSEKIDENLTQKLDEYKNKIEETFDILTEKAQSQSSYLQERISDMNSAMKTVWAEQSESNIKQIDEISDKLKGILDENIKLTAVDYNSLRERLDNFAKELESNNEILTQNLKAQLDDMTKYVDSVLDIQVQETAARADEMSGTMGEFTENVMHKVDQMNSEAGVRAEEMASSLNAFSDKVMQKVDQINSVAGEQLDTANSTRAEIVAIAEIIENTKKLIENINSELDTKTTTITTALATASENETSALSDTADKLLAEMEAGKQTVETIKTFMSEAMQSKLNTISENIEKETDVVINELIEQFDLMKRSQQDYVVQITTGIESIVSNQIYNNIEDLKSYLDVKTDSAVLTDKLDNLKIEMTSVLDSLVSDMNKMLKADVFTSAIADYRVANEILVNSAADRINEKVAGFIGEFSAKITEMVDGGNKNVENKLALFDKKFVDTVVDKYEEIKLISNKYNSAFDSVQNSINGVLTDFQGVKAGFESRIDNLIEAIKKTSDSTNLEIKQLNECFENLRSQISNKSFDEAFQASINKQIASLEKLIKEQFSYIEDITDLCEVNLPDVAELNTLVKGSVLEKLNNLSDKIDSANVNQKIDERFDNVNNLIVETVGNISEQIEAQDIEGVIETALKDTKSDIITQFLNIFNQISFVTEQEEILDFIQEKHEELIKILSHIVTNSSVKKDVSAIDSKIDSVRDEINHINEKITSIISSEGDVDYIYSLQDLESDIANLRIVLKEMKDNTDNYSSEFDNLMASTEGVYKLVESIKDELPDKHAFDGLTEDIVSISTRTNKLLLASDESYKTLKDNLHDFKLVINDLDERTRNFAQESGMDKINSKLNALNSMVQSGAKTNQVFNQVFEYLAEWIDNAGTQINAISDKVETLDEIGQIKVMLADLKAEAEDNSENVELIEALGTVFDKQAKKISNLETKLDKMIVETTINNKIDMRPMEDTLNRFLAAIGDKLASQQEKINSLESAMKKVVNILDEKDTDQLTKKVGGMDRQIAKLNKSIEKIASHVVEK